MSSPNDFLKTRLETREELREQVFIAIARCLSSLGTCDRKRVGAVFVRDGRCITWGYNGAPPGAPHCEDNGHGWGTYEPATEEKAAFRDLSDAAKNAIAEMDYQEQQRVAWDWKGAVTQLADRYGCRNATHAEANGLAFAARQGISTDGCTLFVTVSPCDTCARLLIAAGVVTVYYDEEYRDPAGRELLERCGVACHAIAAS